MAVAGATMPAQHIRKRAGRIYIAHSENRPVSVLVDDPEAAEALLLSTGDVWIPARMRNALERRMKRDILPGLAQE